MPRRHVEPDEVSFECIAREMKEELGIDLVGYRLLACTELTDRIE